MTPTSHNKILGILHLMYAGVTTLLMAVLSIFVLAIMSRMETELVGFIAFIAIVLVLVTLLYAIPSVLAGYAFLKRKRWAKTMGLIAAIVASLNFPFGSALCVFTLKFLFGVSGRLLYPEAAYALPPGDASWARTNSRELERAYVPPSAPPDWR